MRVGQILFRIPIGYLSDRLKSRKLFSVLSGIISFLGSSYLFISNNPNEVLMEGQLLGLLLLVGLLLVFIIRAFSQEMKDSNHQR